MRKLLLTLLPWMAVVATAQSDGIRAAEVSFPLRSETLAPAWQIGLDCYVAVDTLRQWGWRFKIRSTDILVNLEDKQAIVPFRNQSGREIVNLGQLLRKVGADGQWKPGTGIFEVFGVVRAVRVEFENVMVESTLAAAPKVTRLENPDRLVFDFQGLRLDERSAIDIAPEARVGQWQPNTVRVVVETSKTPDLSKIQAKRSFAFNYAVPAPAGTSIPIHGTDQLPVTSDVGTIPKANPAPGPMSAELVGLPDILSDTPEKTVFRFRMTAKMMSTAQIKRTSPSSVELTLPGVRYSGPESPTAQSSATRDFRLLQGPAQTTVTLNLVRPMGIQVSQSGNDVLLVLIKPRIGDGKLSSKTIVVDAGHGGHDPGARSSGAREKDMTLSIAKDLSEALANEGATVVMTRNSDIFIPLTERAEIANRTSADFFISIHINSNSSSSSTTGGITFFHKREPLGMLLAECIQTEIAKVSKLRNLGAWSDQRIYDSGFAVLRHSKMPAVLIEMGFINNYGDRTRMLQRDFQRGVAGAIVKGLKVYLGNE